MRLTHSVLLSWWGFTFYLHYLHVCLERACAHTQSMCCGQRQSVVVDPLLQPCGSQELHSGFHEGFGALTHGAFSLVLDMLILACPTSNTNANLLLETKKSIIKSHRTFFFFPLFGDRVSLYSPGCPRAHYVDQSDSSLNVLELKVYRTMHGKPHKILRPQVYKILKKNKPAAPPSSTLV